MYPNNTQQQPMYQQQPQGNTKPMPMQAEKRKLFSRENLLPAMAALQVLTLLAVIYIINPIGIYQNNTTGEIIKEVSQLTTTNPLETPLVNVIKDVQKIKELNAINAEVYKNATNGDYVVGYSDKMIIYRRQSGDIIYEGQTPAAILESTQQTIITGVTNKAKEAKLIEASSTEAPQVSIVTDAAKLKEENPSFYANAQTNDVIALFSSKKLIVLYRPSTSTIINSGAYNTTIK